MVGKTHIGTVQSIYSRLLIFGIITGYFLPYLHLSTANHDHRYNLLTGEFFDVVPAFFTGKTDFNSPKDAPEFRVSVIGTESDCQIQFKYCNSANGILLNQIVTPPMPVAVMNDCLYSVETADCIQYLSLRNPLSFAPKQSPPQSGLI
ncbi:MAG: hypothetical protein JXX14_08090 [Deltaproteobacteria bacterium]|nr:hypothetical protein [Deltaproteobacteria bacterium]